VARRFRAFSLASFTASRRLQFAQSDLSSVAAIAVPLSSWQPEPAARVNA
jgi:hypothetical protein